MWASSKSLKISPIITEGIFFLHHLPHILSVDLLVFAILTRARRNLKVVLKHISLVARENEHFEIFISHCIFFSWEHCLDPRPIFEWVICYSFFFLSSSCTPDINPLAEVYLWRVFSHHVGFLVSWLIVSLAVPLLTCWPSFLVRWRWQKDCRSWRNLPCACVT